MVDEQPIVKYFSQQTKEIKGKVLLAVSGGVDSLVLVHLFSLSKHRCLIAHCNFQLRGESSDGDEKFVKEVADRYEMPFHTKTFEIKKNIQLAARDLRYQWFNELCDTFGCESIAIAHHLNDDIETVLANLARGTGIKGLAGIAAKSRRRLIRPLIDVSKQEIVRYATKNGLGWREDSSNAKDDYKRNFIRHHLMPNFQQLNPSFETTMKNNIERFSLLSDFLDSEKKKIVDTFLVQETKELVCLKLDWMLDEAHWILLYEILKDYGFQYATFKLMISSIHKSGKKFENLRYIVFVDRKKIYIKQKSDKAITPLIVNQEGRYELSSLQLEILSVRKKEVDFEKLDAYWFDAKKIVMPCLFRKWQHGDSFCPLGLKGNKKISDFLIDKKVPTAKKDTTIVMESNHQIVCVLGYGVSENFKIDHETQQVFKVSWKKV